MKGIAVHFFSLKECASLERELQSLRRHARAESLRGAAPHGSMGVYVSQCYKRGRHVCATSKSLSLKVTSIQAVWRSSALIVVCTSVLVLSPLLSAARRSRAPQTRRGVCVFWYMPALWRAHVGLTRGRRTSAARLRHTECRATCALILQCAAARIQVRAHATRPASLHPPDPQGPITITHRARPS